jgi:hypothetical protein
MRLSAKANIRSSSPFLLNVADMSWIFSEKWLWVVIAALAAILVLPLLIVWVILSLPGYMKVVATVLIVIAWGVAAGYKDWLNEKRRNEERNRSAEA